MGIFSALMERVGELPWLGEMAVRGSLLLTVACVVATVMRGRSAGTRHAVWGAAIGGILLIAVLAGLPGWRVVPIEGKSASVDLQAAEQVVRVVPVVSVQAPELETRQAVDWGRWWLVAWGAGASVILIPMGAAMWALRRVERQARVVQSGVGVAALGQAKKALGVCRDVVLLESDLCKVPMTFGVWRARIVVPADHDGWSAARWRMILTHEMAHVRRHDLGMKWLGQLARGVYWFQPLVWLAVAQLEKEAEKACDDVVVGSGVDAPGYAATLLDIAAGMTRRSVMNFGVLHMARRSTLEVRVRRVLENGCRGQSGWRSRAILGMCVLLVAAAMGVLRAADSQPAIASKAQPQDESRPAATRVASDSYGVVYVMGSMPRPGVYSLDARQHLGVLQMLVSAGLTPDNLKDGTVALVRRGDDDKVSKTIISLADLAQGRIKEIMLQDNDLLLLEAGPEKELTIVPAAMKLEPNVPEEYYVMGAVARPGVYSFSGRKITIKQALASTGTDLEKVRDLDVKLVRRTGDKESTVQVNVAAIFEGLEADLYLQPNDVISVVDKKK